MVKHTQTIRLLLPTNLVSVFDHFVELALKGLIASLNLEVEWKGLNYKSRVKVDFYPYVRISYPPVDPQHIINTHQKLSF